MPKSLKIDFGAITDNNVEILRKVNTACFPISYNDNFYKDVVSRQDEGLNKFAYYGGFVVGAVCTRIEPLASDASRTRLYIMTLGVLAAYRGREVGTQLIQSVMDHYEEKKGDEFETVDEIALHVQISNDDAIRFYTDRFGFVKGDMVENYYRRIDPPHCYLLYKKLK
jgi:ribosomal protein S18 acetylase RimI-like enzyme